MVLHSWLQKYSAINIRKHSCLNMKSHPIIPNNPLIVFSIIGHNDMPPRIHSFWYHSTISTNPLFSRTSRRCPHTEVFWILKGWMYGRECSDEEHHDCAYKKSDGHHDRDCPCVSGDKRLDCTAGQQPYQIGSWACNQKKGRDREQVYESFRIRKDECRIAA